MSREQVLFPAVLTALGLMRSALLSGESYSAELASAYEEALATLRAVRGPDYDWYAEEWRDAGLLRAVREGSALGSMQRARIVEWYEAALTIFPATAHVRDTSGGEE
jgi:hypothetical protein